MNIHHASVFLPSFATKPDLPDVVPPPSETADMERASEEDAKLQKLRETLESEFAEALTRERESGAAQIRAAREAWVEQQAKAMSAALGAAVDDALCALRRDVAKILSPFISREMTARAVGDLVDALRGALANDSAPPMRLSGPRDLLHRVQSALAEEGIATSVVESGGVDISVELGPTILETRLGEWLKSLSQDMSEER